MFNTITEEWSQGPSLNQKRIWHSCFYDHQSNSVFVAGGYNLASTEQWNLDTNQWILTPDLPEPLTNSAEVASQSGQFVGFVAGGYNGDVTNKIYGLRRSDLTWEIIPQQLQTARYRHSMVNLHSNQVPGC